jgi:hypothetical protein
VFPVRYELNFYINLLRNSVFENPCGGVGGDEKGSLKSETVKYGHGSKGTRTQE